MKRRSPLWDADRVFVASPNGYALETTPVASGGLASSDCRRRRNYAEAIPSAAFTLHKQVIHAGLFAETDVGRGCIRVQRTLENRGQFVITLRSDALHDVSLPPSPGRGSGRRTNAAAGRRTRLHPSPSSSLLKNFLMHQTLFRRQCFSGEHSSSDGFKEYNFRVSLRSPVNSYHVL